MNKQIVRKPGSVIADLWGFDPFEEVFGTLFNTTGQGSFRPSMNLIRRDGGYDMQLAVPGYSKDEIKIDVKDDVLTVSGKRATHSEESNASYYLQEFGSSSFARSTKLPKGTNVDAIKASCDNGILTVSLPSGQERQPKQILIE